MRLECIFEKFRSRWQTLALRSLNNISFKRLLFVFYTTAVRIREGKAAKDLQAGK